jgi:4-amino-4-deoxy-L-arabinose transferase-like glycosyltransferase
VLALAATALAVHLALVLDGASRHSAVFDEVVYPTSGYSYLTTGDYRLNREHPPLLKLYTALPWLGSGIDARATPGWVEGDEWAVGMSMIYDRPSGPTLLFRSRVLIALLSVALGGAVFATARRLGGDRAGLAALALYALDPLVVAHAGFATTDLGGAALYFLATIALVPALERGGSLRTGVAGVALGAALAAKFSTLPLLVILPALALWIRRRSGASPATLLVRTGIVAAVAAAVLIASYGPAGPVAFVQGLAMLRYHGEVGHPTYAFGLYSDRGWWWWFPAAWAVKTPIPILAATLGGLPLLLARVRRGPAVLLGLALAPLLLAGAAVTSDLALGVRHLLPATPFLAVAGGLAAERLLRAGRPGILTVGALAVWLAAAVLVVHPDEMAYANEPSGGPDRLWLRLADSSVDWGQDLPALAAAVRAHPLRRVYLGYFGTADPKAYGLPYRSMPSMRMIEKRQEDGPDPAGREWIAISVTNLLEVYSVGKESYAWLRERPFTAFPGRSIALFDVTGDADAHRRLGEVAMRYGDVETAEAPLRRAVELRPDDGEARLDLARVLADRGRRDEAVRECSEAERLLGDARARETCAAIREMR